MNQKSIQKIKKQFKNQKSVDDDKENSLFISKISM